MNELKIFNSEEFGEIRTVNINGEPWFVGKDVTMALGYKDTSDALKKHVEFDDKLTRRFADSGQNREMYIINESGLYALIFGSKLDSAKRFKHWVTSEVLQDAVNKTVVECLGGKGSEAYREISKKVFAECNRDLKHRFQVNARNNVPKLRFEEAVEYAKNWRPCTNTQIMIKDCNAQARMQ